MSPATRERRGCKAMSLAARERRCLALLVRNEGRLRACSFTSRVYESHCCFVCRKTLSHAVWYPSLARAHVTVARGIHFTSLGHSVSRPVHMNSQPSDGGAENIVEHKRLELLPEETLYLIERGTLACSLAYDESREHIPGLIRPAISVQHAYASMIGTVDLTLEKYQVGVAQCRSP
jgi:hypothetical protein